MALLIHYGKLNTVQVIEYRVGEGPGAKGAARVGVPCPSAHAGPVLAAHILSKTEGAALPYRQDRAPESLRPMAELAICRSMMQVALQGCRQGGAPSRSGSPCPVIQTELNRLGGSVFVDLLLDRSMGGGLGVGGLGGSGTSPRAFPGNAGSSIVPRWTPYSGEAVEFQLIFAAIHRLPNCCAY